MPDIVQRYFDAWNDHDSGAIVAAFAQGGTYCDPATGGELSGRAIGAYAQALFEAFPDLQFELIDEEASGQGLAATQWLMRGTNSGPLRSGLPPTDRVIALPGADFIAFGADGIRAVRGYFDQKTLVEQLDWQALVQPKKIGRVAFGSATHASSKNRAKPGAVGLTWLNVETTEEQDRVREATGKVMREILQMPGFIGFATGHVEGHMFTVSAWETVEDLERAMNAPAHAEARKLYTKGRIGSSAFTSVWQPYRFNAFMVRCASCGTVNTVEDAEQGGDTCRCGAALPEAPAYW